MLFKFNTSRWDKFAKTKSRVTNWAEYNQALRQRDGQQRYSDLAIETCLTLRAVFGLPLCQRRRIIRSLLWRMQTDFPMRDFSTLRRHAPSLQIALFVDSAGLVSPELVLAVFALTNEGVVFRRGRGFSTR